MSHCSSLSFYTFLSTQLQRDIYYYLDKQRKAVWTFIPIFLLSQEFVEWLLLMIEKDCPEALELDKANHPMIAPVLALSLTGQDLLWSATSVATPVVKGVNWGSSKMWPRWPLFGGPTGSRDTGAGAKAQNGKL